MPSVLVSVIADRWLFGDPWCQIIGLLTTLLFAACILTLVLISLDRYCAVVTPLRYTTRVTHVRIHYAVATVWIVSAVIAIPPIFGWSRFTYQAEKHSCTVGWKTPASCEKAYTLFLVIVCFCMPFVLMLWVYITIIHVAQANNNRARRNSVLPDGQNQEHRSALNSRASLRRSSLASVTSLGQLFRKDDWKTAKTSLIIVSAFTLCWMPYFVIITLESTLTSPAVLPQTLETCVVLMAFLGCAINPVVYVFRNSAIRHEIGKLLRWSRHGDTANGFCDSSSSRRTSSSHVTSGSDCPRVEEGRRRASSLPAQSSPGNLNGQVLRNNSSDPVMVTLSENGTQNHMNDSVSTIISISPDKNKRKGSVQSIGSTNRVTFNTNNNSSIGEETLLPGQVPPT